MINKEIVKELVKNFIAGRDIFLVDTKVSTTNRITILVNKPSGITIDECVMISRHIESNLDREKEDYELNVSSPGLDMPFRVREQYEMSIGRPVEVIDIEGKKTRGILKNVQGEGFEIESQKVNGKKKESREISLNFDEVKSVKEIIKFK
ncbi:MAG TPA: ribosome assembly cofactor RimP [Bacteroidales bacterium]|nr:ribosome assembly cofactor RimP [Bacteroidales bacterium]